MATIKVKQIKSKIGYPKDQKATLQALGLRKISQVVEVEDTPSAMWISTQISNTKRVHRTTAQGQNQFPAKLCTVVAVSATKSPIAR